MMKYSGKWITFSIFVLSSMLLEATSVHALKAPFKEKKEAVLDVQKPRVRGNCIWYGIRKVEVKEDGTILCSQPDGEIFSLSHYFVEQKNRKYAGSFAPNSKKNKRIFMEKVQFANNTFTQKGRYEYQGSKGEFVQTVQILPDGRLKISNSLTLPLELRKRVMEDGFFFNIPSARTYGKNIELIYGGKKPSSSIYVPDKSNYTLAGNWGVRNTPQQIVSGKDTACETIFLPDPKQTGGWSIRNYHKRTAVRIFARRVKNAASFPASVIVDVRRTVPAEKVTDTRPDFMKLENIRHFDMNQTRNLLPNPSFEQGAGGTARVEFAGFRFNKTKWYGKIFSVDNKVAMEGKSSLRIRTFSKSRRGDWRGIHEAGDCTLLPVVISKGDYVFSCYFKGDQKGQTLSVWAGRTSLPKEKALPGNLKGDRWKKLAGRIVKVTPQWTRMEFPMKVIIDQPMCISFNAVSPNGKGHVWIDCVQLEKGTRATAYQGRLVESCLQTPRENNFLPYGKKHEISLWVKSAYPGKAHTRILDFYDRVLWEKHYSIKKGENRIPMDAPSIKGVFVVKSDYTLSNGTRSFDAHRFSIMKFLNNTHKHKNLYCIDYGPIYQRSNIIDILERARKVGFGSKGWLHCWNKDVFELMKKYNMEFSHGALTTRAGRYGGSYHVVYARSPEYGRWLDRKKIPPVLCPDYRQLTGQDSDVTEEYLKRFKEALKVRIRNYPEVRRWSYAGEDDASDPTFSGLMAPEKRFRNYVKLQLAALEAVKEVDPTLAMIGGQIPCNSYPTGVPAVERFIKTAHALNPKARFDAFAVHTYRNRVENPDLDLDIGRLRAFMKKYGYGDETPLYFPEGGQYNLYYIPAWKLEIAMWNAIGAWLYGAVSYEMGWTEKTVAGLYARHFLTMLKYPNSSFGQIATICGMIFGMDLATTPFATQKAINTMGQLLGDAAFVRDIRFAPTVRSYLFEDGQKRPVAAVWTCDPEIEKGKSDPMIARIPFPAGTSVEILDLMEAPRKAVYDKSKALLLGVSTQVMFLRGKAGSTKLFEQALRKSAIIKGGNIFPLQMKMSLAPHQATFAVTNPAEIEYKSGVSCNRQPMGSLTLGPRARTELKVRFGKQLTYDRILKQPLDLQIGKFYLDHTFSGVLCRKVNGAPQWAKLPRIPLAKWSRTQKDSDFSGYWQMAWNEENFFLRVFVRDDHFCHEEYAVPTKRYDNDSLQIYFDTLCNARTKKSAGYDQDDYEYAFYPDKTGTKGRIFRIHQPDMQLTLGTKTPPSYTFADDMKRSFRKVKGGYVYEVAFPARYVLPIQLKAGTHFGFALFANDRDKGKRADKYLTTATDGKGCYNRPKYYPVVILQK